MNIQMHFLLFTLILLYTQIHKKTVYAEKHIVERECEPSCSNTLPPACNKFEIELRATMSKCATMVSPFSGSSSESGGEDSVGSIDSNAMECGKKLRSTVKIANEGETATHNQYVIIDHVIDSENGQRVSLLNPYVIVLRQKPILQLYGLKYKYVVNAEAKEQVINKRSTHFLGCDDITDNPTCGNIRYNGESIPYSQGFCCSCDERKNLRRQPRSADLYKNPKNSAFHLQEFLFNNLKYDDRDSMSKETPYDKPLLRFKKSVYGLRDYNDYRNQIRSKSVDHLIHVTPRKMPRVVVVRKENDFDRNDVQNNPSLVEDTPNKNFKMNFDINAIQVPNIDKNTRTDDILLSPKKDNMNQLTNEHSFDEDVKKEEAVDAFDNFGKKVEPIFYNNKILDMDENKERLNKFNHFEKDDLHKLDKNKQNEIEDVQDDEPIEKLLPYEKDLLKQKSNVDEGFEESVDKFHDNDVNNIHIVDNIDENVMRNHQSTDEDAKLIEYGDSENEEHFQTRGGQNCDDKWLPKRADPSTYHDSAHCLRFSKLWYAVYQLSDPILEHSLYIRIFEKREKQDGSTTWIDLTQGKTVNVGSFQNKNYARNSDFCITYDNLQRSGDSLPYALDPKVKQLLIPQNGPVESVEKTAETQGGAPEYLVVDKTQLDPSGERCNTAGVGYSAFYNQAHRCMVPKNTCLQNQPRHLWRQDKEACSHGKQKRKGRFFLKNFAIVPDDALRRTKEGDTNYLALHYTEKIKSTIEIEVKADDNMIFRSASLAKIIEVYIESLTRSTTTITIKLHNNGLISNVFYPRLTDCPLELPADWANLEGAPTLIPPQHHYSFTLRLLGILPAKNFYCSVEAINSRNEIVAVRRIRIVRHDRCICSWHCLCACYETTGLGCIPMSMEHYQAAGFIGSMPLTTNMIKVGSLEKAMFGIFYFIFLLIIILLLMGLTKALIGFFCYVPIGIWGLDMIIGIQKLDRYYEPEWDGVSVVYDDEGWPVNPETNERSVRIVNIRVEFCLNIIFFFTYPIMLLLLLIKKFGCPFYTYIGDEDKEHYFEGVSTVIYTKCPDDNVVSGSGSEGMFDFMDESSKEE